MKNIFNWIRQMLNLSIKSSIITSSILFTFLVFFIITSLILTVFGLIFSGPSNDLSLDDVKLVKTSGTSNNKLVIMKLNGTVVDPYQDSQISFISAPSINGYNVKKNILTLANKSETKALLIDLNTYGGSPDSARLINEGINYYKEKTKNPVIVYVDAAATSAGAMLSSNATKIFANPSAIVANIGVAGGVIFNYKNPVSVKFGTDGVDTRDGIEGKQLYAGKFKRQANPFQPTQEEIDNVSLGQNLINQVYNDFVTQIVKDRGVDEQVLRTEIGAKALLAKDAIKYKLVDELLTREQAIDKTLELAGIKNDYSIYTLEDNLSGIASLLKLSPINIKPQTKFNFCDSPSPILHLETKDKLCN